MFEVGDAHLMLISTIAIMFSVFCSTINHIDCFKASPGIIEFTY